MPAKQHQTLLQHTSEDGPRLCAVRGSLLLSSLHVLRDTGNYDHYLGLLPKLHHEEVLFATATAWLPAELAMTHYAACEALGLSAPELERIGGMVSDRIMGTLLGTIMRSSRALGAGPDPWAALKAYDRLWDRLIRGGGCRVVELGPKDALIESMGVPMFSFRYYRTAYLGLVRGAAHIFAKKAFAREQRSSGDYDSSMSIALSWV